MSDLKGLKVLKKFDQVEDWSDEKIRSAVSRAAERTVDEVISDEAVASVLAYLHDMFKDLDEVNVALIHYNVLIALNKFAPEVANAYKSYINYKQQHAANWESIYQQSSVVLRQGDRENANFDSTLTSTKGSLIRGYTTREIYLKAFMTDAERKAHEHGSIYIHDLRDLVLNTVNCCLLDLGPVLKGGFKLAPVKYTEPRSVLAALQVTGDIMLSATAQQYGGMTIPDIDKVMIPYVYKSIERYKQEAAKWGVDRTADYVFNHVWDELKQGFQSIEMKLNSIPSSRGDFAFTTFSFGNVDCIDPSDREIQMLICRAILHVREQGQGNNEPVTFPKLVFLYNSKEHKTDPAYDELFKASIHCSSKAMYPDYLAIDTTGYVSEVYKRTGQAISPMGCRSYLTDWTNSEGKTVITGRANIGVVSLNLPLIWMDSNGEETSFYNNLRNNMEIIRNFFKKRYEKIAHNKASSNPIAFTQGGFHNGYRNPSDDIGMDIVKSFTASFGITALNELNVLMEGKPLHESDRVKINEVIDFINTTIEEFKQVDGFLYGSYATPAESLCGTQLRQFREQYGVIPGVSDREYFTNGFHCHVTADITPIEKQDSEFELFHKINGGHIQYARFSNSANEEAIEAVVLRAMEMGFYFGVNFDLVVCEDCGHRPTKVVEECPHCKSKEILMISRLCGYLGYSKLNGETRLNFSKQQEVDERVSM